MIRATELVNKAIECATKYKTLYVMGCFGAPMNAKNKERYKNNHSYNRKSARQKMIDNATPDTFGFDCVCLIKALCGDWCGDVNLTYGGTKVFKVNGKLVYGLDKDVPDYGADGMIKYCNDVSKDFSKIVPGCMVWLSGHAGIYIGNGLVVESSPAFENKVQITACGNLGTKTGYNTRKWTKYGYLPFVDYSGVKVCPTCGRPL